MKRIISLLLILFLFITSSINIYGDDNVFYINNINDWNKLAKYCELDTYSNNLIVELNNSITFNDEFVSIPYFNGTFNGNNHTLLNININSSLINDGVFRVTGKNSNINNLSAIIKADHNAYHFGFVGYNQGKIINVSVNGDINANNQSGMIVGYNSVNGDIENCNSEGSISGKHIIGGIVGNNYGKVASSKNNSLINTEVEKEDLDISTITIESLTSADSVTKISDIGGICGSNFGTIENVSNNGDVGHEHLGYNIGGVVGSQSGYLYNSSNNGNVNGRKDVGGIAGQMEPSMALIFSEDYLQIMRYQIKNMYNDTSSLVDDLNKTNDKNIEYLDNAVDSLGQAYDAVELMLGKSFEDPDFEKGKTALTSSMHNVISTFKSFVDTKEEYKDAYAKLKDIAGEGKIFGNTAVDFIDSVSVEKDMYKDVSKWDNDNNKDGKIKQCTNYGNVEGDINVGGITGSMAVESDLNPEDDFSIIGATSLDMRYEIKSIIDSSNNYGMIFIKRNYAGGICGNQNLGLIKNCINYGMLNCEDGNYVGGIAGKSDALINNNYSKCFIYGNNYVGGIAGSSLNGENNGSFAQILSYSSNAGSIFGNYANINEEIVDKADGIINNFYVYDDLAAIDGISYANKAYQISEDEMLNKDLNENLKKVNVIFMDDNEIVFKRTLEYNASLEEMDIPLNIIKNNEYQNWVGFDMSLLKNIKKDLLFICGYDDVYPSISSNEEPLAKVIVNGKFTAEDCVQVNQIDEAPISGCKDYVTYDISIDYSLDSKLDSFNIYNNGYKLYKVYVKDSSGWKSIKFKEDGRYAFVENPDIRMVSIVKVSDNSMVIIIACGSVLVLGCILLILSKVRKKKK